MPSDIRDLLRDAAREDGSTLGFGGIWKRSRSIRARRWTAMGAGVVVAVVVATTASVVWRDRSAPELPVPPVAPSPSEDRRLVDVGGTPLVVAAGADAVWVGRIERHRGEASYSIARIDPSSNEVVASIPVDGRPHLLAAGEGAVWAGVSFAPSKGGALVEIDPALNEIRGDPVSTGAAPFDLALTRDGVWVVSGGEVLRIDPDTHEVVVRSDADEQGAIAAHADDVWVATTSGDIARIDPDTGERVGRGAAVGWNVTNVAADGSALWANQTTPSEQFRILRLDPSSLEVTATIPLDLNPGALATGPGSLWVLQHAIRNEDLDRDGTIVRIDPDQSRIVGEPIPTGTGSVDISVANGTLWVANAAEGVVYRIETDG